MVQALKAIYRNGTFILKTDCTLPEGSEVELVLQSYQLIPPKLNNIADRKVFLKKLVDRMQHNPIPSEAPHFTREMLHERR